MQTKKNRWLIALAGVGIHISIGSVYAWSVFTTPLQESIGWSLSQVSITFSIAILFLGLSAAFMGHFVEAKGPRKSGLVSTVFFAAGMITAGFGIQLEMLWLLYVGYGVLGGIGLGIGYITPVSTLVKWFPDRRGMATGLAIMGFGFAAMIASPVMRMLIESVGIPNTFFILGAIYFTVMFVSSLYLERPPEGYHPKGVVIGESVGVEIAGLTAGAAAFMVGVMGVFNGAGRLVWASISDYIGRTNLYTLFFVLQIGIFAVLPFTTNEWLFQILLFIMISCYGGGFSAIPAYIGDIFGTKQLGAIHGYILTAWAAAGLAGPFIVAKIYEATQSYAWSLYIFAGLFVIALVISIFIRQDIKRLKEKNKLDSVSASAK